VDNKLVMNRTITFQVVGKRISIEFREKKKKTYTKELFAKNCESNNCSFDCNKESCSISCWK
jgi:hypothetical protein